MALTACVGERAAEAYPRVVLPSSSTRFSSIISAPVGGTVVLQSVFVFLAEFDLADSDCLKREREALVREELGGANRKGAVRRKWNNIAV